MTRSIVIAAFVAILGSSAFAQSFDPTIGTGNIRPFRYEPQKAPGKHVNRPGYDANAQAGSEWTVRNSPTVWGAGTRPSSAPYLPGAYNNISR